LDIGGITVNREITQYSEKNVLSPFFPTQTPRGAVRDIANKEQLRNQKRLNVAKELSLGKFHPFYRPRRLLGTVQV
jgi:hypothetical protein